MPYTKPQVVIDLEEYNELKKAEQALKEGDVALYQKAITAVILSSIRSGSKIETFQEVLKHQGLNMMIRNNVGSDGMSVIISKFNDGKN